MFIFYRCFATAFKVLFMLNKNENILPNLVQSATWLSLLLLHYSYQYNLNKKIVAKN